MASSEKTCLRGFANNKGADQPAHPRSLINAIVIHLLENIISGLAMSNLYFKGCVFFSIIWHLSSWTERADCFTYFTGLDKEDNSP